MENPGTKNHTQSNGRAAVSLARCESYELARVRGALEETVWLLGGLEKFVKPGMRVLLKPNLVVGRPAEQAINTHPVFVEAVAQMVLDLGGKPTIGDSPGFPSARNAAKPCGVADVAKRLGIKVIEMDRPVSIEPRLGPKRMKIRMSKTALDFDAIVNLPKLKCHSQLYMTVATKNLFGLVPFKRKALWHVRIGEEPELFARMLVQVADVAAPALTLVDAIVGLERNGPCHGDPRQVGVVMAGTDCSAIDRVAVEIAGADPERMLTLKAAEELGSGITQLDKIDILGTSIEEASVPDFVKVEKVISIHFPMRMIPSLALRYIRRRFTHPHEPV